jgi:phosphotransferase system enzyme I (PtsI)
MARSLGIPAVVGLHDVTEKLESGGVALLDGFSGELIVNPTAETLAYYGDVEVRQFKVSKKLAELREQPSTTRDGQHIVLSANIELPDEIVNVATNGAEGISFYTWTVIRFQEKTNNTKPIAASPKPFGRTR